MEGPIERRNLTARRVLTKRIRNEFHEVPGLILTSPQAARLFGVSAEICSRILAELVHERKLKRRAERFCAVR